jgi:hypothetical protein
MLHGRMMPVPENRISDTLASSGQHVDGIAMCRQAMEKLRHTEDLE